MNYNKVYNARKIKLCKAGDKHQYLVYKIQRISVEMKDK